MPSYQRWRWPMPKILSQPTTDCIHFRRFSYAWCYVWMAGMCWRRWGALCWRWLWCNWCWMLLLRCRLAERSRTDGQSPRSAKRALQLLTLPPYFWLHLPMATGSMNMQQTRSGGRGGWFEQLIILLLLLSIGHRLLDDNLLVKRQTTTQTTTDACFENLMQHGTPEVVILSPLDSWPHSFRIPSNIPHLIHQPSLAFLRHYFTNNNQFVDLARFLSVLSRLPRVVVSLRTPNAETETMDSATQFPTY